MTNVVDSTLGLEADVVVRVLPAEVAWDVVGPRPTKGAHRGMRARKEVVHHHSVGE